MADSMPDIALETALRQLTEQAKVRWGAGYVAEHTALLEQAAGYVTRIGCNLPKPEREPGFYQ